MKNRIFGSTTRGGTATRSGSPFRTTEPQALQRAESVLKSWPVAAIGIGLCAGLAVGWFLKRR